MKGKELSETKSLTACSDVNAGWPVWLLMMWSMRFPFL